MKKLVLFKGNNPKRKKIKLYHWLKNNSKHHRMSTTFRTIKFILMLGNYYSNIPKFLKKNFEIKAAYNRHARKHRRKRKLKAYYCSYPESVWNDIINQLATQVGGDGASLKSLEQTFINQVKAKRKRKRDQRRASKAKRSAERRTRKLQTKKAQTTRKKRNIKRLKNARRNLYLSKCKNQAITEIKIMKGEK